MNNVLIIGENEDLKRRVEADLAGRQSSLKVSLRGWPEVKRQPDSLSGADLLVVDLTAPDAYKARGLAELQRRHARMLLVLSPDTKLSQSEAMTRLLESPTVDFVRPLADAEEVRGRIQRLLGRFDSPPRTARPDARAFPRELVTELHDPLNGRLDARRIADHFGISLADVARVLGVSLSRLHKTPTAASAQKGLFVFERIAYGLLTLVGTWEAARAWLRIPEKAFSGKTPLEVTLEGRGPAIADMLDDMMVGQPS